MFSYEKIKDLVKDELLIIEKRLTDNILINSDLSGSIKLFLNEKSKRLRVVLPLLYFKANSTKITNEQLELLSVVEIVHNASLIHDDIIDDCELRRGKETLSKIYGNKFGVISGDYLLSIAMNKLCSLNNIDIIQKFSETIEKMCLGEIYQYDNKYKLGTIEDYIEKSKNKTAYLFETAFVCCGIAGDFENLDNLSRFGLNLGLAYQIRDDINNIKNIDITKPSGNDMQDGIYNAPMILGTKEDNYSSGIEKTTYLLNNYLKGANSELEILPDNKYKLALKQFLELLGNV